VCGKLKPKSEFYITQASTGQRRTDCKSCHIKKSVKRNRNNPRRRDIELRNVYGITEAQYEAMLKEQNGVCFVCGKVNSNGRRLSVDHNHETKEIRKLLCAPCNQGIGCFHEDPNKMRKAIKYLEEICHSK